VLEECQRRVLETMQQTGRKAVLYDLTHDAADASQRAAVPAHLNEHVRTSTSGGRSSCRTPRIAHLARLAFGVGDYKLFYDDLDAAERFCATPARFRTPTGACASPRKGVCVNAGLRCARAADASATASQAEARRERVRGQPAP
jgi:hypothetical protein